jgi:hypothetical protein
MDGEEEKAAKQGLTDLATSGKNQWRSCRDTAPRAGLKCFERSSSNAHAQDEAKLPKHKKTMDNTSWHA